MSDTKSVGGIHGSIELDPKPAENAVASLAEKTIKFTADNTRAWESWQRKVTGALASLKGDAATEQLRVLEQAVEKAGGAANLNAAQVENLGKKIERLAAQGATVPPSLNAVTDRLKQMRAEAAKAAAASTALDGFRSRVAALTAEITGKAAAQKVAELAKAIQQAGGVGALSAPQLEKVKQQLTGLAAEGAKVPPALQGLIQQEAPLKKVGEAIAGGGGIQGALTALGPAGTAAATGVAVLTAVITGVATATVMSTRQFMATSAALTDLSHQTDIAVEDLQRFKFVGDAAGVSGEELAKSVAKMQKELVKSPQSFDALGLSVDKLLQMKPQEQFMEIVAALGRIPDATARSAAAQEIFGQGAAGVLRMVKEDVGALNDAYDRLGIEISGDVVGAGDKLDDSVRVLTITWDNFTSKLGQFVAQSGLVAYVERATEALGRLNVTLGSTAGQDALKQSLDSFKEWLFALNPQLAKFVDLAKKAQDVGLLPKLEQGETRIRSAAYAGPNAKRAQSARDAREDQEANAKRLAAERKAAEERQKLAEDAVRKNEEIARRNQDLDQKVAADVLQRARETGEARLKLQTDYQNRELVGRAAAAERAVRHAQDVADREKRIVEEGAKNRKSIEAETGAIIQEAADRKLSAVDREVGAINRARAAALLHQDKQRDLLGVTKETEKAIDEAKDAINEMADAEIAAAKVDGLIDKFGKLQSLFGAMGGLFEQLGVQADSGLGRSVQAAEELAGAAQHGLEAFKAFKDKNYLAAAIEGIKALSGVIGVVKDVFFPPEWKKVMQGVGREYGVAISQGLAEKIAEDSSRLGDRVAAILKNLKAVIDEAGGVGEFGFDKATAKARDLFSAIERGSLSVKEAGKSFDAVFGDLAEHLEKTKGLATEQFLELMRLDAQFGTQSQAIKDYLGRRLDALQGNLDTLLSSGLSTEAGATAVGSSLAAAFNQALANGVSGWDALQDLRPQIDAFEKQLEQLGLSGGAAFEAIRSMAALAGDEVAGPLFEKFRAATGAMTELHNMGLLTQETFGGLAAEAGAAYEKLREEGKSGSDALRLLQPDLQRVWELKKRYNFELDEATAKLLAEAEAAGLVGAAHMSAEERSATAMERMANTLDRIAERWGIVTQRVNEFSDAVGNIPTPGGGPGNWSPPTWTPPGAPSYPGFASGGAVDAGDEAVGFLHGREVVIPADRPSAIAADVAKQIAAHLGIGDEIRGLRHDIRVNQRQLPLALRAALEQS